MEQVEIFTIRNKSTYFRMRGIALWILNLSKKVERLLYLKNRLFHSKLKVACILDEFSYQCFKYECELIPFRPNNWKEILVKKRPNMLFVESAWKGNDGTWQYKIGKYSNQGKNELIQLIKWCKEHKIATVFWNKEDPIHFGKFIDSAKLFDFIFTTDENCVDKYKSILGHNNVYVLPFAAQPKIHNPIRSFKSKRDRLCFAGSYYVNRHEERKKDLEDLLDVAMVYGLDIYDRNYNKNGEVKTLFSYPERFQSHIQGSVRYDEITKIYKEYKILLNVNSVKSSPTMFSRRVFEILACGTPVVSTYALGIENTLGDELVPMGNSKEDYEEIIRKMITDSDFYEGICIQGIREILSYHTYSHRLTSVAKKIGLEVLDKNLPKVSVVSIVEDDCQLKRVLNNYQRQSYSNKELIIVYPQERIIKKLEGSILQGEEYFDKHSIKTKNLNHHMNNLYDGDYISCFSCHNYYGSNYLNDLMNGRKYTDSKIIGKGSYFNYEDDSNKLKAINTENEFVYVPKIKMTACIIEKKLLDKIELDNLYKYFENIEVSSQDFNSVQTIFSIDKYNFINEFYLHSLDEEAEKNFINKVDI